MKVHLTQCLVIIGKDKREWLKISGITDEGEAISGLLPKPDVLPEVNIGLADLEQYSTTDVQFDQRGRVVSVE